MEGFLLTWETPSDTHSQLQNARLGLVRQLMQGQSGDHQLQRTFRSPSQRAAGLRSLALCSSPLSSASLPQRTLAFGNYLLLRIYSAPTAKGTPFLVGSKDLLISTWLIKGCFICLTRGFTSLPAMFLPVLGFEVYLTVLSCSRIIWQSWHQWNLQWLIFDPGRKDLRA